MEALTDNPPPLPLHSDGLLSRWGFGDGDVLFDYICDHLEDHGVQVMDVDEAEVLRALVRKHLLPELRKHHEIELVDIDCNHNPIRARRVDGVDVTDLWRDSNQQQVTLRPDCVEVPVAAVLEEIRRSQATPA